MPYKSICTALTPMNATETTKTLIDSVKVPQGLTKLVGVGATVCAKGLTTLESISGIIELESDDMSPNPFPQAFPLPSQNVLTSGAVALQPYLHPTNIAVQALATIKVYATMDAALTINPSVRAHLVFE